MFATLDACLSCTFMLTILFCPRHIYSIINYSLVSAHIPPWTELAKQSRKIRIVDAFGPSAIPC